MQTSEPLTSWKAIASYLGCDERTAQRWEAECGLPVHRTPGRKRGSVFGFKHELDEWLRRGGDKLPSTVAVTELHTSNDTEPGASKEALSISSPVQPTSHRKYFVGIGGGIALILIGTGMAVFLRSSVAAVPAKITFTADAIQALDAGGQALWSHRFSKPIDPYFLNRPELLTKLIRIADINGNGNQEVLVTVPLRGGPNSSDLTIMEIDCFSSSGGLLWSYVSEATFRFGAYDLQGPWWVRDIFISAQKRPKIWAALAHYEWGNSFVVQLDPATGNATMRFVNTGIIYKLNEVRASGRAYLLAGGFNNEYAAGSLAVIDESIPFTVSPQTAGTRHKCVSCPEGTPDYYFVFPRSEVNLEQKVWEDSVQMINVNGDQFEIWKMELGEAGRDMPTPAVRSIYLFHVAPAFQPYAFRFDSGYDMLHKDLQHQGKLDHALDACPERLHPQPVRVWTPIAGWSQIEMFPVRAVD